MRFNGKELAALALHPSHKFNKEGILLVREKQEGIFRRGEVSSERWCRLRGNMLFYFKSRDQYSEPAGVLILEQFTVKLDSSSSDEKFYSFTIVFDSDGGSIQFCASTETERDAWIQALHMASYEYMRTQMKALHGKLEEMAGKSHLNERVEEDGCKRRNLSESGNECYVEISISCDNLLCDGDGQPPNPVVFLMLKSPKYPKWSIYAQTEVIQRSSNPCFLTTINLWHLDLKPPDTSVKLVVYDVKERLTATMTVLGTCHISAEQFLGADKANFRFNLLSGDGMSVGFVSINAYQMNAESGTQISSSKPVGGRASNQDEPEEGGKFSVQPVVMPLKMRTSHLDNLNSMFDNVVSQTYRLHTGLGADLSVHEVMGESKLCFSFPQTILQLFIKEEKELLHTLTSIGNLKEEWNKRQTELLDRHLHLINTYTLSLQDMDSHTGSNFKPSSVKNCQTLEFVPVNLHLQRLWIHNENIKKSGLYDVFTVGAFTAHSRRFRHGGLSRILGQLRQLNCSKSDKLLSIAEAVARIKQVKSSLENMVTEILQHAAVKDAGKMCSSMTEISTKAHQLIGICDTSLIDEACGMFEELRGAQPTVGGDTTDSNGVVSPERKNSAEYIKQVKERSRSLDGSYVTAGLQDELPAYVGSLQTIMDCKIVLDGHPKLMGNRKLDYKKESSSPRSVRRRSVRMTRQGSLKEDGRLRNSPLTVRCSSAVMAIDSFDSLARDTDKQNIGEKRATFISKANNLVLVNNAKNEESEFLESDKDAEKSQKQEEKEGRLARSKSPDEPEPWDLTQLNIEASVMCMASKVQSLCRISGKKDSKTDSRLASTNCDFDQVNWVTELSPSVKKLNQALDCLLKTAHLTHVIYLLLEPFQIAAQQGSVQHRRDIVFVQALTSVVVGVVTKLYCHRLDVTFLSHLSKAGLLAQFEGLLSCHGDEMGMLEDMVVGVEDLGRVTFKVVLAEGNSVMTPPSVEGSRLLMTVTIPVPESVFCQLPLEGSKEFLFKVTPAFFNVGINEQASIAERESCSPSCMHSVPLSARKSIACMYTATPNSKRFGDVSLQDRINNEGLEKLMEYYSKYKQVPVTPEKGRRASVSGSSVVVIPQLLEKLSAHVHSRKAKNVDILCTAAQICRLLGGLRFTSCKSAKDRTSMSVTLEQAVVLKEEFDLAEHEFARALECMRCEGTRRENTLKNAGVRKYAFNSLQLMALPRLYRPPAGTYGNVQT